MRQRLTRLFSPQFLIVSGALLLGITGAILCWIFLLPRNGMPDAEAQKRGYPDAATYNRVYRFLRKVDQQKQADVQDLQEAQALLTVPSDNAHSTVLSVLCSLGDNTPANQRVVQFLLPYAHGKDQNIRYSIALGFTYSQIPLARQIFHAMRNDPDEAIRRVVAQREEPDRTPVKKP